MNPKNLNTASKGRVPLKALALGATVAAALSLGGVIASPASADDGSPYLIRQQGTNTCLSINHVGDGRGNAIGVPCNKSDNDQAWYFRRNESDKHYTKIVNRENAGLCLDTGGKGDLVYTTFCQSGNEHQVWWDYYEGGLQHQFAAKLSNINLLVIDPDNTVHARYEDPKGFQDVYGQNS